MEQEPNKPFEGFIYQDHLEKMQKLNQQADDLVWNKLFEPKNENMEQTTQTLQYNIRKIIMDKCEGQRGGDILNTWEAAEELEKLFLQEKIDLLEELKDQNDTDYEDTYRYIDNKIKSLKEQLNNI